MTTASPRGSNMPPDRYRTGWLTVWSLALTLGMCVAFWVLPLGGAIGVFVLGATSCGLGSLAHHQWKTASRQTDPRAVRLAGTHAVVGGTCVLGVAGVASASGVVLALLLLVAALTSPWAVAYVGRRIRSGGGVAQGVQLSVVERDPGAEPLQPFEAQSLTDRDLCLAWRASFTALQQVSSVSARERVVLLRLAYLDEFERRNPTGLSAWLASGPRAASSPGRYLVSKPPGDRRDAG